MRRDAISACWLFFWASLAFKSCSILRASLCMVFSGQGFRIGDAKGSARRGLLSGWGHASVGIGSSCRTSRSATSGQKLKKRNCGREWEPSRSMPLSPWSTQQQAAAGRRESRRVAGWKKFQRQRGG